MATVEDRKDAQRGDVRTLLRLIGEGEVSLIGKDWWYVYDDTVPNGYWLPDVDRLIERGLAKPEGHYEIHLTDAGVAKLAEQDATVPAASAGENDATT